MDGQAEDADQEGGKDGAAADAVDAARQTDAQAEGRQAQPDYRTLYESASRTWAFTGSREITAYLAQVDVHAPGKLRGNRALQSCDAFFTAFDIRRGDGMWLDPEARVQIW